MFPFLSQRPDLQSNLQRPAPYCELPVVTATTLKSTFCSIAEHPLCAEARSLRPLRPEEESEQHQAVRAPCVHHGLVRGPGARLPLIREGYCGLGGPAP